MAPRHASQRGGMSSARASATGSSPGARTVPGGAGERLQAGRRRALGRRAVDSLEAAQRALGLLELALLESVIEATEQDGPVLERSSLALVHPGHRDDVARPRVGGLPVRTGTCIHADDGVESEQHELSQRVPRTPARRAAPRFEGRV
jgi:hypothetical protein